MTNSAAPSAAAALRPEPSQECAVPRFSVWTTLFRPGRRGRCSRSPDSRVVPSRQKRHRGGLYLNNRYHDPALASFLSVDPLVTTTGEPYIYGSANPTTLSDPSGLCPYTGCWEAFDAWLRGYATAAKYVQGANEVSPGDPLPHERRVWYAERLAGWSFESQGKRASHLPEPRLYGQHVTDNAFTIGIDWDFCVFLCTPDFGISSHGPYIKLGVGVGLESPGLEIRDEAPVCGARTTEARASAGVGLSGSGLEFGYAASAVRDLGSSSWSGQHGPAIGRSFGDSAAVGGGVSVGTGGVSYKGISIGAGVSHEATLC